MIRQTTVFDEEESNKHVAQEAAPRQEVPKSEREKISREAYKEGVKDALSDSVKSGQEESVEEGRKEAVREKAKDEVKKHIQAEQDIKLLSKNSEHILLRIHTLFPFDLFPDTVCIDTNKMSITSRNFFFSESITTVLLKEMTDVTVETALFLAQLIIIYSHHPMKPMTVRITNLKRNDAIKAKEILQGLLVLHKEKVDLTNITSDKNMKQLESLGTSKGGE